MCGIVGIAGNILVKEREVFRDMLIACQVRGRDATGAISVGADNSVGWAKTVGTPDKLFDTKSFDKNVDRYNAKVLIGHCRAKTMGENIHKNAHPFDHDNIVGVHNGTLQGWRAKTGAQNFQVDSDFLFSKIAEDGIDLTIPETTGAWALTYWDRADNTLNFLRNEERPMYFAWSVDKKTMFWASEPWMLHGVVGRTIRLADLEGGLNTHRLAPDEFWSFSVEKTGEFKAATPRKLEGAKSYTNFTVGGSPSNTHYRRQSTSTGTGGSGVTGPFQAGTPQYLLENLRNMKKQTMEANSLPGLPKPDSKPTTDQTNTSCISSDSTTTSSNRSVTATDWKPINKLNSKENSRPLLSLVPSHTTNNGNCSGVRHPLLTHGPTSTKSLTDLRKIGSVWYITDRKTGTEYSEIQFASNTDRKCSWCRSEDIDLKDVFEFVDEFNIICYECNQDHAVA